jgi:hypothetical protein
MMLSSRMLMVAPVKNGRIFSVRASTLKEYQPGPSETVCSQRASLSWKVSTTSSPGSSPVGRIQVNSVAVGVRTHASVLHSSQELPVPREKSPLGRRQQG